MKHFIFSILPAFLISSGIFAQFDSVIYSNDGISLLLRTNESTAPNQTALRFKGAPAEIFSSPEPITQSNPELTPSASKNSSTENSIPTQYLETLSTGGCDSPMPSNDFNDALISMDTKPFEDSKMNFSKRFTSANCLSADQIKRVMQKFVLENNKLVYAKFAYAYCLDQSSFYHVNEAFEFEPTIDELNEFLETQ